MKLAQLSRATRAWISMSDKHQPDRNSTRRPPAPAPTLDSAIFSGTLERLLLAGRVEARRCSAGETIFREGETGDAAFYVRDGAVDILGDSPDGERRLLNHVRRGEVFGEMALIERRERIADAVAAQPCELIVIPGDQILPLLRESPELSLWLLQQFSHRLRIMTRLATQMEEVQAVNRKILAGQEEERRRIGRDVHDGIAQTFVDHILRVQLVQTVLDADPERARTILTELEGSLRDGRDRLRELIYDLYPKDLSTVGLAGAIERFVGRVAEPTRLRVHFDSAGAGTALPPGLESTLYFLVQEALNNVRKHANASNAWIKLSRAGERLILVVEDDGDGLDPDITIDPTLCASSYGLLSMRERAQLAGGEMVMRSRPGAGAQLRFELPIADDD